MRYVVYKFLGSGNELLYVGYSSCFEIRLSAHKYDKPWFHEVKKHEIEEFTTEKEARRRERMLILTYQPKYNVAGKSKKRLYRQSPRQRRKYGDWSGGDYYPSRRS